MLMDVEESRSEGICGRERIVDYGNDAKGEFVADLESATREEMRRRREGTRIAAHLQEERRKSARSGVVDEVNDEIRDQWGRRKRERSGGGRGAAVEGATVGEGKTRSGEEIWSIGRVGGGRGVVNGERRGVTDSEERESTGGSVRQGLGRGMERGWRLKEWRIN